MAHLLMRGNCLSERSEAELMDQAQAAIQSDQPLVARAARTALQKLAEQKESKQEETNNA
jgi:hypothetical protein